MLTKNYNRRFIPATPEIPHRPAYTVCEPQPGSGHYVQVCTRWDPPLSDGGVQVPPGAQLVVVYGDEIDPLTGRFVVIDAYYLVCVPRWVQTEPDGEQVCTLVPEQPYQPATPARWEMTMFLEWNAGANSNPQQEGDCEVEFPMGAVIGAVVGLTPERNGVDDPLRLTHALYFHQTLNGQPRFRVMESGTGRTIDMMYDAGDAFRIRRAGNGVTYWHQGNLVHSSIVPSAGTLSVGVALYASGDWIVGGAGGDDPDPDPGPGPGPDPEPPFIVALAVSHPNDPYVSVYPWNNSTGFVTRYAPPADPVPWIQSVKPAFHPDGDALVVAANNANVYAYEWSNNGFGARYANPAAPPYATNSTDVEFRPQGDYVAVTAAAGSTGRRLYLYPWDKETGFGVAPTLFGPSGNNNGVTWSPSGNVLAVAHANAPRLTCRPFDDETGMTGTAYADPATQPTGTGNDVAFHPSGEAVAIAHTTSPFISVYEWDDTTGFGAKYSDPVTLPNNTGRGVSFHPDGDALAVAHDGGAPFISVYPFNLSTGFGTKYSNPATVPPSTAWDTSFSPDGNVLVVSHSGSPFVSAYPWSSVTGFGVRYANPFAMPGGNGLGVAWRPLPVEDP